MRFSTVYQSAFLTTLVFIFISTPAFGQDSTPKQGEKKASDSAKEKVSKSKDPFGGGNPFSDPFADPNAPQPIKKKGSSGKEKSLTEELDDLEQDINQAERLGRYGTMEVRNLADKLEKEFLKNADDLKSLSPESNSNEVERTKNRQRVLSLYLWQLQRLGGSLAPRYDYQNSPMSRATKLMSKFRPPNIDQAAYEKIRVLMRRASSLSRLRSVGSSGAFYFVDPAAKRDESKRDSADPFGGSSYSASVGDPFEKKVAQLHRILKLSWQDGHLVWDRDHWQVPFANKSLDDIRKEVEELMTQHGLPTKPDPDTKRPALRPSTERPALVLLFEDLQHQFSGYVRTSFLSSRTKVWRQSCSKNDVDTNVFVSGKEAEFRIRLLSGKRKSLHFYSRQPNELRITLSSSDGVVIFTLRKDGRVKYTEVTDDETYSIHADSFVQLYRENVDAVENRMFPKFREYAIQLPSLRTDQPMVDRFMLALNSVNKETQEHFETLMDEVDSESFGKRVAATKELQENMTKYLRLLIKADKSDQLPLEVQTRLKQVLSTYSDQDRQLDLLINKLELQEDVGYLIQLLDKLTGSDQEKVVQTLQDLTKQSIGADAKAWDRWHVKQSLIEGSVD